MENAPRAALLLPLLAAALIGAAGVAAQEPAEETQPPVAVETLRIEPDQPGADTLCKLWVTLRNRGEETASQFGFTVSVNGQELSVYRNQLFMFPLTAGETAELRLFNFWSTETGRELPADGRMTVSVRLNEARWMKIGVADGVEVWDPIGPVEGLPSSAALTLRMRAP